MAEVATLARPYAEALFKAAGERAADAAAWLQELASVAAHPQLLDFAAHPKVTTQQVYDLVAGLLSVPLPPIGQNFLRTVIDNDRLRVLPEIARQFRALLNAQQGVADARVESAFALDEAQLASLQSVLERRFGRALRLQVQVRPELIGGVRVVVGDQVLDTSVAARLEQMRVALLA
ncbi:ATP synthase subunit delta [Tepidimonas alkaliphilus]|uniref:ATP synthase subunit delta n=1 Tax=Tepidimonas alkaliphilus TaxID=2588942 RepID=A0A554WBQ9_9BURK|nr:F0F1 ATP synthase subunit delta [Tepidimonas alkaliphilus]TSE21005.1 ATP synthase subunit delta [Tepidimonas alkaliphilus]